MLKRVKRRVSKQYSFEKPEDLVNPGKTDTFSETEVFQQVIAELRAEVKSLTEQLEQERKAASDAKSLKTKQISTLTSKLANAVRQRERAEEDLDKMKKEMEELKEHLRLQADEREASQSSSLEMCNSNHIFIHSFETDEETQEGKEANTQEFKQIEEDLCVVQENMNHGLGENVKSVTEERQKILESANQSSAKGRVCAENSEENQKSSPLSSPEPVLSGYTLNSTDEKAVNLLMCHEMGDEHGTAMFPGNEDKEERVHPKGFLKEYDSDDDTRETTKAQDKKALEDLITDEEAAESVLNKHYNPTLEDRCLSSKTIGEVNQAEKGVRQSSEEQNDLPSHSLREEFRDLKQQLKNALRKIEELRLEKKEMKREIRNLSSSALEQEFLLKTTKFTDRLLKEMKERDAKMYVPGVSHTEKYELESKSKSTDLGQMRSTGGENQSVGRNTSLPLKIIGAKLKELTESVESMATDPELCQENFTDLYVSDVMGYKQRFPNLNDQFKLEELLIIPAPCSEEISQSAPFKQENPREQQQGGGNTSVEKLGEKSFLASSKVQLQFAEEEWKDGRFQQTDRQTREQGDSDSPRVQRYVVRSSDHIAKMRDLTPEEKAFYSK